MVRIFDIDGTISSLKNTPEEATLEPAFIKYIQTTRTSTDIINLVLTGREDRRVFP